MDGFDVYKSISNGIPVEANFHSGKVDENGLRTGSGVDKWEKGNNYQTYKGEYLQDSLHGTGTYTWSSNGSKCVYEGQFYANNLEGYGEFTYPNGNIFAGLFKRNQPFGPGVLTYTNGREDVGLWYGKSLVKLNCIVYPEWIPKLAKTPTAKIQLLKYRKLVPIGKPTNTAKEILHELGANDAVLEKSDQLYSIYVRNPDSELFNQTLHDKQYFGEIDCVIEIAIPPDEQDTEEIKVNAVENSSQRYTELIDDEPKPFEKVTVSEPVYDESTVENLVENYTKQLYEVEENLEEIYIEINKYKTIMNSCNISQLSEASDASSFMPETFPEGSTVSSTVNKAEEKVLEEKIATMDEYRTVEELYGCAMENKARLYSQKNLLLEKISNVQRKEHPPKRASARLFTKKIIVSNLLSWNNEAIMGEILKHTFLHRNGEANVVFSVPRLLTGEWLSRKFGVHQDECATFLEDCSNGNRKHILDLLTSSQILPDVCDARGNTGILFATSRDRVKVIEILAKFGANLSIVNDECLTPLNLSIARYLAVQNEVIDWENAFLAKGLVESGKNEKVNQWRPHISATNIGSYLNKPKYVLDTLEFSSVIKSKCEPRLNSVEINCIVSQSFMEIHEKAKEPIIYDIEFQQPYNYSNTDGSFQAYILSTECIKPPPPKNEKQKLKKKGEGKKQTKAKKSSKSSKTSKSTKKSKNLKKTPPITPAPSPSIAELPKPESEPNPTLGKLKIIHQTISTLLHFGANPNEGEFPLPPLILAIFTRNPSLIKNLLDAKADPNVTTLDEAMSALHVLVSLPYFPEMTNILDILLAGGANPNCRTNTCHWQTEKNDVLAKCVEDVEDIGKSPLHLLAMRYDFILDDSDYASQIAQMLLRNKADPSKLYLGHTPLSLAILRGNTRLVKILLESNVDPNQTLGQNMGNALTIFILKRYSDIIPYINYQEIMDLLLEHYANPLNLVNGTENAVEFMIKEHEDVKTEKKKKDKGKKGKKSLKKSTKASSKRISKGSRKSKEKPQEVIKEYLVKCGQDSLLKHAQGKAVEFLYAFLREDECKDNLSTNLAKLLLPDQVFNVLQLIVYEGKIKPMDYNSETFRDLIDFVKLHYEEKKDNKKTGNILKVIPTEELLENLDLRKQLRNEKQKIYGKDPSIDTQEHKYKACFYCCGKLGKELYLCPECELIYFCSEECNKASVKQKTQHRCNIVFYNKEKQRADDFAQRGEIWANRSKLEEKLGYVKELKHQRQLDEIENTSICFTSNNLTGKINATQSRGVMESSNQRKMKAKNRKISDKVDQHIPVLGKLGHKIGKRKEQYDINPNVEGELERETKRRHNCYNKASGKTNSINISKKREKRDEHQTETDTNESQEKHENTSTPKIGKTDDTKKLKVQNTEDTNSKKYNTPSIHKITDDQNVSGKRLKKNGTLKQNKKMDENNQEGDKSIHLSSEALFNRPKFKKRVDKSGKDFKDKDQTGAEKLSKIGNNSEKVNESPLNQLKVKTKGFGEGGQSDSFLQTYDECTGKRNTRKYFKKEEDFNMGHGKSGIKSKSKSSPKNPTSKWSTTDSEQEHVSPVKKKQPKIENRSFTASGKSRDFRNEEHPNRRQRKNSIKSKSKSLPKNPSCKLSTTASERDNVSPAKKQQPKKQKKSVTASVKNRRKSPSQTKSPNQKKVQYNSNSPDRAHELDNNTFRNNKPTEALKFSRLPKQFQYFIEKISTFFPDMDMSLLFLPYACYHEGQLYYRFLANKPVFIETYSNI